MDNLTRRVVPLMGEDGILWFAYPKGNDLGKHGFEGVRMVAIDEDWSALRFRKADHIKTMTRSFAMTVVGRKKVAESKKNLRLDRNHPFGVKGGAQLQEF